MRLRGSTDLTAFSFRLSEALLVLFVWLIFSLLCGLGNVGTLDSHSIAQFILWSTGLLSIVAAMSLLSTTERDFRVLCFFVATALVLLPLFIFPPPASERTMLLELFYVLIITTPVLFRIWSWRWQLLLSLAALLFVAVKWIPLGGFATWYLATMVAASGLLSTLVAYVRRTELSERIVDAEIDSIHLAQQLARTQFPKRARNVATLQLYLLGVLVFLDTLPHAFNNANDLLAHVNSLVVGIFGALLLNVLKPLYLSRATLLTTICIGAALAFSSTGQGNHFGSIILPLIYLSFSTAALPWPSAFQILVGWLLLLSGVTAILIHTPGDFTSVLSFVAAGFQANQFDITALVSGVAFSVVAAHMIRQNQLQELTSGVDLETDSPSGRNTLRNQGVEALRYSMRSELEKARIGKLLTGLIFIGIFSGGITALSLLLESALRWPWALTGLTVIASSVSLVAVLRRNERWSPQLGQIAGIVALILILTPAALIITKLGTSEAWIIWAAFIAMSLGIAPWAGSELLLVTTVTSVAAAEIVRQLHLGFSGGIILTLCVVAGLLSATSQLHRLKQSLLLKNFQNALGDTQSPEDCLRLLADSLLMLFDSQAALLSQHANVLELVRSSRVFRLSPSDWPLENLRRQLTLTPDGSGIAFASVRWLPSHWTLFDKRFGLFSAIHGVVLELRSAGEGDPCSVVFVSSPWPFFDLLHIREIQLSRTLAAMTNYRLQLFGQKAQARHTEQLSEATQMEREYELSTLVHDINNTVQDLTLLCDSVLDDLTDQTNATVAAQVRQIGVMARSMATVVSDAKRKRELERLSDLTPRELIEVTTIIEEIVAFATVRAGRKRIQATGEGLSDEKLWVKLSAREHFETILRNLLNNAIMYSDPGTQVTVRLRSDDTWVWIDVIDTGPGLSQEECKSIFLPGYRGRSGSSVVGGLGIGLAQSKRVATSAGGDVEVYSAGAGQGSTFTVRLPRHAAPPTMIDNRSWALMVDDQPALTEFYAKVARALHVVPVLASSVNEAVNTVRERGRPTFVLTDLHLGASDGLDLVRFLREQFGINLPILVVSGMNDQDVEEKVRRAGATDFVAKPIGRRALFARIQSLFPHT